jgi:hypothetical protein
MESCREVLAILSEPERKEVLEEMLERIAAGKRRNPPVEVDKSDEGSSEDAMQNEGTASYE